MNKYRLSIMIVLIIMVLLYMLGIVEISEVSNFAFTSSALIFSISSAVDTFAKENKLEKLIRFVLDTFAISVVVLIPNLKDTNLVKLIMNQFDTNVLLLLALFFTMAGQWATEIKLKDIENNHKQR
ncbi:hypothetical protein [Lacrimispora sp.]|uniref:hypothetical protein n=1 Tax=Lacrimispora sp. TaxID=2719234 RepID=UPI0032E48016